MDYGVDGAGNSILRHNYQTTKQPLVSGLHENGSDGSASATSKDRIKLADHHVLSGVR